MSDRNEAFSEWRKGIISDDNLQQVLNDLETVIDVLYAMDDRGATMHGFRMQFESAKSMYEARNRDRIDGPEKAADASPQKRRPGRPKKETPATEQAKADGLEEILPKGGSGGGSSGDKVAVIEDGEVKGITDLQSQTTSILPKDVTQYRAWVLEWLENFDVPGDILGRWDAELKLRRACGVEQEERLSIRAIVDQRIKELTK